MDVQIVTHEIRLQEWITIVKECRNSGKTIKAWCEENNINIKTYYRWQKIVCQKVCPELSVTPAQKLKNDFEPVQAKNGVVFAELSVPKEHAGAVALTIERRDIKIHIYFGADRATVETALVALRTLC